MPIPFDEFSKMACTFVFKLTLCDMLFLPLLHLSEPHDVLLRDYSTTEENRGRQTLTSLFKKGTLALHNAVLNSADLDIALMVFL